MIKYGLYNRNPKFFLMKISTIALSLLMYIFSNGANADQSYFSYKEDTPLLLDEFPLAETYVDELDCDAFSAHLSIQSADENTYKGDFSRLFLRKFDEFTDQHARLCKVEKVYIRQYLNGSLVADYYPRSESAQKWPVSRTAVEIHKISREKSLDEKDLIAYYYAKNSSMAAFAGMLDERVFSFLSSKGSHSREVLLVSIDLFKDLDPANIKEKFKQRSDYNLFEDPDPKDMETVCEAGAITYCQNIEWSENHTLNEAMHSGGVFPQYAVDIIRRIEDFSSVGLFQAVMAKKLVFRDAKLASLYEDVLSGKDIPLQEGPPSERQIIGALNMAVARRCQGGVQSTGGDAAFGFAGDSHFCQFNSFGNSVTYKFPSADNVVCAPAEEASYTCSFRTRAILSFRVQGFDSLQTQRGFSMIPALRGGPWRTITARFGPVQGGWRVLGIDSVE